MHLSSVLKSVDDKTLGRTRLSLWLMSPVAVMTHAKLSKIEVSADPSLKLQASVFPASCTFCDCGCPRLCLFHLASKLALNVSVCVCVFRYICECI